MEDFLRCMVTVPIFAHNVSVFSFISGNALKLNIFVVVD